MTDQDDDDDQVKLLNPVKVRNIYYISFIYLCAFCHCSAYNTVLLLQCVLDLLNSAVFICLMPSQLGWGIVLVLIT